MSDKTLKVGALARRTGLSVRALHHYDEIGLLSPTRRTRSGHRLYGVAEVRRLQQIASLRQLGLSLGEIRDCLERPEFSLERVLSLQIDRMRDEIERRRTLCARLEELRERLRAGKDVEVDQVTHTIEGTTRAERYYTPEQLRTLARRAEAIGGDRIAESQAEWEALMDSFRTAMEEGLDPGVEPVRRLARKAQALVLEFTGGDQGIRASLTEMYRKEGGPAVMQGHGMSVSAELWEYMGAARKALLDPRDRGA